jgi:hypothetical protein
VRNELRELIEDRPGHRYATYYAIQVRLAGARPGAENDRKRPEAPHRLMVAQLKFVAGAGAHKNDDFSPLLALRYEDDLLFVTTELMGRAIPLALDRNRCKGGLLARPRNDGLTDRPFRVLVASEDGKLPFDFDPTFHSKILCLRTGQKSGDITFRGSTAFPRQPRDQFFRLVMRIDGGTDATASMRMVLNGAPVASVFGRITRDVTSTNTYFKFGPYGDLPKGRRPYVDYADFRRAPNCRELGLTDWKGLLRNNCMPKHMVAR